jgi:hypothetical protein
MIIRYTNFNIIQKVNKLEKKYFQLSNLST